MREYKVDGSAQRALLSALITNGVLLARVAVHWDGRLFASEAENQIAGWAVSHWKKYNQPIGRRVEDRFRVWVDEHPDNPATKLIEVLLSSLSDEYENIEQGSNEYLLDVAGKHFNGVRLRKLREALESDLEFGDYESAEARVQAYRRLELGATAAIDLNEQDELIAAFEETENAALLSYPGALGDFIGNEFCRDSFVAIMASSKRGKTWWMIDLAVRAVKAQRNVAYFEAGDLSKRQLLRRFCQRILRRPKTSSTVAYPIGLVDGDGPPEIESRFYEAADPVVAHNAWMKITQGYPHIKITCFANGTLLMASVDSLLKEWARDGWVADVVIIDYADLLAPPVGMRADERESINENWKHMRRLSQELHGCVITATQADAESYDRGLLSRRNFSGDRRKHDHVTAMFALNATDTDKKNGITRVNFLDRRDGEFTEGAQVKVAGCLAVGMPVVASALWHRGPENAEI